MRTAMIALSIGLLLAPPGPVESQTTELPTEIARQGSYDIGLLSRAEHLIAAKGLMVLGRELSGDEQRAISLADEIGAMMGVSGRSSLGPMAELARQAGVFQEAVRALVRGDHEQAARGLLYVLGVFPDAKIVHACLFEVFAAAGADPQAIRGHWALSCGHIPSEDLMLLGLVRASATDPDLQQTQLPENLQQLSQMNPSIATFGRAWAGLLLAGHEDLAGMVKADVLSALTADDAGEIAYPELAAAAVVELTDAAIGATRPPSEPTTASGGADHLAMAAIAACDGRWTEECIPLIEAALPHGAQPDMRMLIECALAIAKAVEAGTPWRPAGSLPERHELPVTAALAARN